LGSQDVEIQLTVSDTGQSPCRLRGKD